MANIQKSDALFKSVATLADIDDKVSKGILMNTELKKRFSTANGTASMLIGDDSISITKDDNGIFISKDNVIINGRQHMVKDIDKNRVNGFWCWNPELLTCLPSTVYTPIPVLLYTDPPAAKRASALVGLLTGV